MVVKNVYGLFLVLNELISKRVDQRLVEYIKNNAKGNVIKATHEEIEGILALPGRWYQGF